MSACLICLVACCLDWLGLAFKFYSVCFVVVIAKARNLYVAIFIYPIALSALILLTFSSLDHSVLSFSSTMQFSTSFCTILSTRIAF